MDGLAALWRHVAPSSGDVRNDGPRQRKEVRRQCKSNCALADKIVYS